MKIVRAYTTDELIYELVKDGTLLENYVVVGEDGEVGALFSIEENLLFSHIFENDALYKQSIDFIKSRGKVYRDLLALKKEYPDLIF